MCKGGVALRSETYLLTVYTRNGLFYTLLNLKCVGRHPFAPVHMVRRSGEGEDCITVWASLVYFPVARNVTADTLYELHTKSFLYFMPSTNYMSCYPSFLHYVT
jgi:hypothetical protein